MADDGADLPTDSQPNCLTGRFAPDTRFFVKMRGLTPFGAWFGAAAG